MSNGNDLKSIEILLVEDSPSDIRLTEEVFKESEINNNVTVVKNGVEALAYLSREGKHENAVWPDLILLDLNLPKKNGREVLAEIKTNVIRSIENFWLTIVKLAAK